METAIPPGGFRPDVPVSEAAARFFELLKTLGAAATGTPPDWSALAAPLARQFEQWLRLSQSAGPWFAAAAGAAPGAPAAGFAPAAWSFASLPLGAAATPASESQRALELFGRLGQLQAQLAAHWGEVANTASQRFVARVASIAAAPGTVDQALKLYELWVSCAEEAYAATVHRSDFGRLQADIANATAALLLEQRRYAETLARAFGLPTRSEVDALNAELRELRRELTAARPGAGREATAAPQAPSEMRGASPVKGRARPVQGPKRPPAKRPRPSGTRARVRRPRR